MGLPNTVRVKISSEGIESAAMTPVIVQEMPTEELVRLMLGVTGKDPDRVREILTRGSLVSGASRFRWEGLDADPPALTAFLSRYPDPDPSRRFDPAQCTEVVLKGAGTRPLAVEREAGSKRRLFRRKSFWDEMMLLVQSPVYVDYSYKERVDIFRQQLDEAAQRNLAAAAKLLAYSTYERQVAASGFSRLELKVPRSI